MVHGTVKGLLGLISTLVVIVVVAVAALAYRLSRGPLPLSFLTPTIEQALGEVTGSLTIGLDDTQLVWDAESAALELRVRNLHAIGSDGRALATVPDSSISISGAALLRGHVALRGLRLIRPRLRLLRDAQGDFAIGLGEQADADTAALLDAAIAETLLGKKPIPGAGSTFRVGGLEKIEITGGDLDFDDKVLDMSWHAPHVDAVLSRDDAGVSGSVRGTLYFGDEPVTLDAHGLYRPDTATLAATAAWTGVRPASFARLLPASLPLARFQLTTAGNADFRYSLAKGLTDLTLTATGAAGTVDLAPWLSVPLKVASASVRGKLADGLDSFVLDDLRLDLGGPKIALSGRANGLNGAPRIEASARIDDLPVETAKTLWPVKLAPNPRGWLVANLSGGMLRHVDAKVVATVPVSGTIEPVVEALSGAMQGDGMTVRYFGSLPPARDVSASAVFDKDSLTITAKGGRAAGVVLKGGTAKLTGLSGGDQILTVDLDGETSVPDALKLLDSKPLDYASALGFDPNRAKGTATISVDLRMPLVKNLKISQVKLQAHARTTGLAIPKAALGLDLADGALTIDVDPRGMAVAGTATLAAIPIDLQWRENFGGDGVRGHYVVKTALDDAGRKAIGLDDPAFQPPVVSGRVPVEATATTYADGHGEVSLKADMTPVAMRLPGLNWSKAAGAAGGLEATLSLAAGGIAAVPRFALTAAGGMDMQGDIVFDVAGHPRRISLTRAKWGRTDLAGTVSFKPDGSLGIDVSGAAFDASELAGGGPGDQHLEVRQQLAVTAKLGRVWLSGDGSIQNVAAVLVRGPRHWSNIRVNATVGQGRSLRAEVRPATQQTRRTLHVTCDDAGAVFAAFGILKNMRGGAMTVDGLYYDGDPAQPLVGTVKVSDYRLMNAPLMARVLTVAALTGAVDVLSGSGIYFSQAEAQFSLANGVVTLKDARTSGTELGITAKGQIDLDNDQLALQGTIVPAYAINGILNSIPLIGTLLTGEKGGGLIAFNYSVKGPSADPSVSVNPLSALTPGFLRGLFGMFDDDSGTKVPTLPRGEPSTPSTDSGDR